MNTGICGRGDAYGMALIFFVVHLDDRIAEMTLMTFVWHVECACGWLWVYFEEEQMLWREDGSYGKI